MDEPLMQLGLEAGWGSEDPEALAIPGDVPMMVTDARDRASTKATLLELVQHALTRASAGV